jgi:hypothetical protein
MGTQFGDTAVHYAACYGFKDIIQLFMESPRGRQGDPDVQNDVSC